MRAESSATWSECPIKGILHCRLFGESNGNAAAGPRGARSASRVAEGVAYPLDATAVQAVEDQYVEAAVRVSPAAGEIMSSYNFV